MNAIVQQPEQRRSILATMASRYDMEPEAFEATLRGTIMKPDKDGNAPTKPEFAAFLVVANEYNLNPLTKEIYAFFDRQRGGIIPIVGVDGWARIINEHRAFNGMSFLDERDDKGNVIAITCRMFRRDREHPIEATEYLAECKRDTSPWKQWPRRMLRHKAMIQAARYAFGFAGIYDQDEAERIAADHARDITPPRVAANAPLADRLTALKDRHPSTEQAEADSPAAPVTDPEASESDSQSAPQTSGSISIDDAIDGDPPNQSVKFDAYAYLRGRTDFAAGAKRRAVPGEYRDDDVSAAAWEKGWDDAKQEGGVA